MISFRNPYFLLLIIPVLLAALCVFLSKRRTASAKLPNPVPAIRTLRVRLFQIVPPLLKILALILICFALARPQKVLKTEIPPTEGIDIMLVLDTSYSMAAMDFAPNRMEAAKAAAAEFVRKRKNDRIGLTVFGGAVLLSCPLTLDYATLLESIAAADLSMTYVDGTAIGDAIVAGVNHLKDSKAKSKVMVLLTDGRSNVGIITDLGLAAKTAKTFGIKVYTIGTAGKGDAKIPTGNPLQPVATMADDLDEPTLREIAAITGGEFYRAQNASELNGIYSRIDSLEKTKFETKSTSSYTDYYNFLLLPAILLFLLAAISERTVFRSIP